MPPNVPIQGPADEDSSAASADGQGRDLAPVAPPATRMRIRSVTGRGSSPEKGLARLHSLELEADDGSTTTFGRLSHDNRPTAQISPLILGGRQLFDRCPICLEPGPSDREHVPPEALGGTVMTMTCKRCNNQFGTVAENDLLDWYEDALQRVAFSHADVPGARRSDRLLLRSTPEGKPVLLPEGFVDPQIARKFGPGTNFDLHYSPPDRRRVRLAALKNAYLGACLVSGEILTTPEAEQVRAELMEARELRRRDPIVLGPAARAIRLARSQGPAVPGQVALVHATPSDETDPHFAVSLAGTLLVSWVFGGGIRLEPPGRDAVEYALGGIPDNAD